ncbi:DUF2500 family protein [Paenibacillus nanensis]|nr:DUF2500 family protein [Paenibacillus nanensis]
MIAIITTLFIFKIIRDMRFRELESKAAVELVRSTVISKRKEQSKSTSGKFTGFAYFVVFDVRGEQMEMQILSEEQFRELRIGQKGLLQYQRKNRSLLFIHFDKD